MKTPRYALSAFFALFCLSSHAEEPQPAPQYQVEMIIFETTALRGWTEEYWPWPDELKDALDAQNTPQTAETPENTDQTEVAENQALKKAGGPPVLDLSESTPMPDTGLIPEQTPEEPEESQWSLTDILSGLVSEGAPFWIQRIKPVPANQFLLADALKKLTPKHGYRVITHLAWTQAAIRQNQARPLAIDAETPAGDTLSGTVMFYKNRFAHIDLELKLLRKIPLSLRDTFAQHEQLPLKLLPERWPFYLQASRKIKSGPWYYVDHPLFGALITIRKVSSPN